MVRKFLKRNSCKKFLQKNLGKKGLDKIILGKIILGKKGLGKIILGKKGLGKIILGNPQLKVRRQLVRLANLSSVMALRRFLFTILIPILITSFITILITYFITSLITFLITILITISHILILCRLSTSVAKRFPTFHHLVRTCQVICGGIQPMFSPRTICTVHVYTVQCTMYNGTCWYITVS